MGMTFDASKVLINIEAVRAKMAADGQRRAVLAGARVIGAAMVERIPVLAGKNEGSDSLNPGELKENVRVRTKRIDGETVGLAGPAGGAGKYGKIAYDVEYGHRMVTGGESKLGADGNFHGGGKASEKDVPAHPCLRPAFEASAGQALAAMGQSLGETLKESVK
jgi:hypothetical protein